MPAFDLPNEIWCKIFSYLPFQPKKNATATCKLWFRLIREDPKISRYILIHLRSIPKQTEIDFFELKKKNKHKLLIKSETLHSKSVRHVLQRILYKKIKQTKHFVLHQTNHVGGALLSPFIFHF